jgi:hypothetical protein
MTYIDKRNTSLFPERYELELYREIRKKLNHLGFQIEDDPNYDDLIDQLNRILIEVTLGIDTADNGASQLIYGIAKNNLENILYLGLADSETYGYLPVGEQTISGVLEVVKNGKECNVRKDIVKEISNRLDAVGYWDYIPLPPKMNFKEL